MKAFWLVIFGSIVYGFLPIFSKDALDNGFLASNVVLYRFAITAVVCFIIVLLTKKNLKINKKQFIHLMSFGILGNGLTALFITLSLNYISTGLANMIHFGYPAVVMIIMIVFFKEGVHFLKIFSIIFALTGIVLLSNVKGEGDFRGIILVLLTTITYSAYIIANKKSSFSSLDTLVILFYVSLGLSVVLFSYSIIAGTFQIPKTFNLWLDLLAIAILCTVFSLGLLMYGIKKLGSSVAAVLNMFEPTTTVIAGVIIYKEALTLNIIIGSSLVVLSTICIMFLNTREHIRINRNKT